MADNKRLGGASDAPPVFFRVNAKKTGEAREGNTIFLRVLTKLGQSLREAREGNGIFLSVVV